ncbi:MAG: rhodanese-like domain-containing protein [Bacteroidota bacterium]
MEEVKVVTGIGEPLSGMVLVFDSQNHRYLKIAIQAKPERQKIHELEKSYGNADCIQVPGIDAKVFQETIAKDDNPKILDVRSVAEYQVDHLSNSVNIPLDKLALPEEFKTQEKPVFVLCQSGKRSEMAVIKLQKEYPELTFYSVLGGMNALNLVEIQKA